MLVVPKRVRPLDKQHAFESRRLWESVTSRLLTREYGEANKHKHIIEQRQRDHAAERKKKGEEFVFSLWRLMFSTECFLGIYLYISKKISAMGFLN